MQAVTNCNARPLHVTHTDVKKRQIIVLALWVMHINLNSNIARQQVTLALGTDNTATRQQHR